MSNIGIQGVGIIFPGGRGLSELNDYIYMGNNKLSNVNIPLSNDTKPAFLIDRTIFSHSPFKSKLRKADPLTLFAVESANDALKDAAIQSEPNEIGLIFSTAFGSQTASFEYQDSILSYGESEPSPTKFSHSLHNSSASYITNMLNIKGPCITVSNFHNSFINALITAIAWLKEEKCKYVLLGASDIYNSYIGYIFNELLNSQKNNLESVETINAIPGEGSVFFILEKTKDPKYCFLNVHDKTDLINSDFNISANFNTNINQSIQNKNMANFSELFGVSAIIDSLSLACGINILKYQKQIHSKFMNNFFDCNFSKNIENVNIIRFLNNNYLPYIHLNLK